MKFEAISIFPEYFRVLELSLLGKAQAKGLLDLKVTDLRDFTSDIHKTVDDSPYGGGAGMVMMAEPWGKALDQSLADADSDTVLIFTTPAGKRFDQAMATEFAGKSRVIFACGRYEGIDQRVVEHYSKLVETREVSIGDYVLNGGEVAAIAMIEAISRLIPGVIGNTESLVEESHNEGLLEYPSYTKPASWRDLEVPEVLLSGNHAEIAKWRMLQRQQRTKNNRPDLL